jgi:CRP-like cAMP-binding protein
VVQEEGSGKNNRRRIKEILEFAAREISIFRLLEPEEIARIDSYFELNSHSLGSVVIKEGSHVGYLGIVAVGKIEARHKPSVEGHEMVIAHLEKGTFFGSVSSPGGRPAMATLVAEKDTEILCLGEESFNDLAVHHPQTAVRLLKGIIEVLSIRLDNAIDRVVLLS